MPYAGRAPLPPLDLDQISRRRTEQQRAQGRPQLAVPTLPVRSSSVVVPDVPRDAGNFNASQDSLAISSASPSLTPVPSPRGAPPGPAESTASLPLPMSPSPPRQVRPRAPERMPSAPRFGPGAWRTASPFVEAPEAACRHGALDPMERDLRRGRALLAVLREQDARAYAVDDAQQRHDGHELLKLGAVLRSFGKQVELLGYRPPAQPVSASTGARLAVRAGELEAHNESKLRALRLAMAHMQLARPPSAQAGDGGGEGTSPPLSRQSSQSSARSQPFLRWTSQRNPSEAPSSSARSSLSADSLFSRESIQSMSTDVSSAASANSVALSENVLSARMLDPLVADLDAICDNAWNLEQCTHNLPSVLLRLEAVEAWVFGLRLGRKRQAEAEGAAFGACPEARSGRSP